MGLVIKDNLTLSSGNTALNPNHPWHITQKHLFYNIFNVRHIYEKSKDHKILFFNPLTLLKLEFRDLKKGRSLLRRANSVLHGIYPYICISK